MQFRDQIRAGYVEKPTCGKRQEDKREISGIACKEKADQGANYRSARCHEVEKKGLKLAETSIDKNGKVTDFLWDLV